MFSKIEGMSRDLVSLQPTLHMNVTIIPVTNMNESLDATLPMTCFEIRVPCLPCDVPVSKQVSDLSSFVNNFENINNPYLRAHNEDNKDSSSLRRRNLRNIASNILEISNNDSTDAEKALLKEIERIRHLSMISASNDSNEDASETGDPDFYDNYDTSSSIEINTSSVPTEFYKDYEYTTQTTDVTLSSTIQSTDHSDSNTLSSFYETISFQPNNFSEDITSIDTIYSNASTTIDTFTQNVDISSTSIINDYSTNVDMTYTNTDFTITSESKYLNINTNTNFTTDTSSVKYETSLIDDVDLSTTTDASSITENVVTCADISFNCSISCGNKNITKIFYMSKCKIIDTKCYITQCSTLRDNLDNVQKNTTNSSIVDVVYIDVNNRKMYNLSKETKKKLLKLCWETMFGQELIKLTMMDLVSN